MHQAPVTSFTHHRIVARIEWQLRLPGIADRVLTFALGGACFMAIDYCRSPHNGRSTEGAQEDQLRLGPGKVLLQDELTAEC